MTVEQRLEELKRQIAKLKAELKQLRKKVKK